MWRSAVQLRAGLQKRNNCTSQLFRFFFFNGGIAQLVEHLLCKQGVAGSNPTISTKNLVATWRPFFVEIVDDASASLGGGIPRHPLCRPSASESLIPTIRRPFFVEIVDDASASLGGVPPKPPASAFGLRVFDSDNSATFFCGDSRMALPLHWGAFPPNPLPRFAPKKQKRGAGKAKLHPRLVKIHWWGAKQADLHPASPNSHSGWDEDAF